MLKTIRSRLLALLLVFTIFNLSVLLISWLYTSKKTEIDFFISKVNELNTKVLNDSEVIHDFFTYETVNPQFFETGKSSYLQEHEKNIMDIENSLQYLTKSKTASDFQLNSRINAVNQLLAKYNILLDSMHHLILSRGFKDYGCEGEMREYIHKIENIENSNKLEMLMLRRHEKDFIIRGETKYVAEFNTRLKSFYTEIQYNENFSTREKIQQTFLLEKYGESFNRLVELEYLMGLKNNTALKYDIDSIRKSINNNFGEINLQAQEKKDSWNRQMRVWYMGIGIAILLIGIIFSFTASKLFSRRLTLVTKNMEQFVNSNFTKNVYLVHGDSDNEINNLIRNYSKMKQEIVVLLNNFQKKVDMQMEEVMEQKNKIEQQNEEIRAQSDDMFQKSRMIQIQNEELEQKNVNIINSITYAKRIQAALLPPVEKIKEYFDDAFVFYKPRDIISGDFYWVKHIKTPNNQYTVIAAADCTGHGVPGALMSMLGVALLNEITLKKSESSPAIMLDKMREKIISYFAQNIDNRSAGDGMDIGLAVLNKKERTLQYAGANRPLYLFRNNDFINVGGDKMPVGKYVINDKKFSNNTIKLEENDVVYMFSDGFSDQTGGNQGRKFLTKNLRSLFEKIYMMPFPEQELILQQTFDNWRGSYEQIDDVLVLGLKIKF